MSKDLKETDISTTDLSDLDTSPTEILTETPTDTVESKASTISTETHSTSFLLQILAFIILFINIFILSVYIFIFLWNRRSQQSNGDGIIIMFAIIPLLAITFFITIFVQMLLSGYIHYVIVIGIIILSLLAYSNPIILKFFSNFLPFNRGVITIDHLRSQLINSEKMVVTEENKL